MDSSMNRMGGPPPNYTPDGVLAGIARVVPLFKAATRRDSATTTNDPREVTRGSAARPRRHYPHGAAGDNRRDVTRTRLSARFTGK
jgi:hypothetical protein